MFISESNWNVQESVDLRCTCRAISIAYLECHHFFTYIIPLRSGSCATTYRKSSLIFLSMSSLEKKNLSSFYEVPLLKIHFKKYFLGSLMYCS